MTPLTAPADLHTTAGKLADLDRRRYEAVHAGAARQVERQHAKGKMTARERIDALLDPGSFTEFDELARHRATDFGMARNRPYGDGVVTGYGTIDGRPGGRVQPGLHRQRRIARRGVRREDRQGHGLRAEDRLPDDRHQRQRRRPDPGRRGRARPVRRDLLPERDLLRRHPADLADHGPVRGRRRVLARHHRLHPDGGQDLLHVHHRPGGDQDGDRRGGQPGGSRRRARAQRQVRRRALPGSRRAGLPGLRPRAAVLPAVQQPGRAAGRPGRGRSGGRARAHRRPTPSWTR